VGTLQPSIAARRAQGIKTRSVNLALAVVRRILNLATHLWCDENGLTWRDTTPLIQILPVTDARKPDRNRSSGLCYGSAALSFAALSAKLRVVATAGGTGIACSEGETVPAQSRPLCRTLPPGQFVSHSTRLRLSQHPW
jgi:hypothetical protein